MPPWCWNSSANKPSYEANLDYTVAPKCCSSCFQKVGSIQLVTHAQQASLVMVWICFSFFMSLPDQQFSIFDDLKVKTTLGPPLQSFCPSGLKDQRDEFRLFLWLWLRYAVGKTKTVIEVTISGVYSKYAIFSKSPRLADLELDKRLSALCIVFPFCDSDLKRRQTGSSVQ